MPERRHDETWAFVRLEVERRAKPSERSGGEQVTSRRAPTDPLIQPVQGERQRGAPLLV